MSFFDYPNGGVGVKICGVTQGEQALRIAALGADAIGVNFWPQSKRHIDFDEARPWLDELDGLVTRIGVFVNAGIDEIVRVLASGAIDCAQLHGDESPHDVDGLLQQGLPAYKALGVKDQGALDSIATYPGTAILLDAFAPREYGGTGETFDWNLGRMAVERYPGKKVVLAGGLVPGNVADAIHQAHPFAVDTASGVEAGTPGVKDMDKVERFLDAVKNEKH